MRIRPLLSKQAVRRLLLGERRDRRVRAVRAVVQPEQRIGAAGGVEHRLDLRRRDRHGRRRLMAGHAGAPVGAQALKERIVLVDRRAVDRHDARGAVRVGEGVARQGGHDACSTSG